MVQGRAIALEDVEYYRPSLFANSFVVIFPEVILPDSPSNPSFPVDETVAIDNRTIIDQRISDHTLEFQTVDGIPIYTWNVWAYGSLNGFSDQRETDLAQYRTKRFTPQVNIILRLFRDNPNAIVCLQEVSQSSFDFIAQLGSILTPLKIAMEYNKKTGNQAFGQLILYRPDVYTPVKPSIGKDVRYSNGTAAPFQFSDAVNVQNDRALKVYFQENSGKRRLIAVVNAHLASYQATDRSTKVPPLLEALIKYARGAQSPALTIITGDFNYDLNNYKPATNVSVYPAGTSYSFSNGSQQANITDGFVVVK
jgi:endonuclease/exonuclease/phosphatase family metal-dependent hydrolase